MTTSSLLLLHAETPTHPGTGSSLGAVDLPVARERVTQWPMIPGSSLKGILRDTCRRNHEGGLEKEGALWNVFGGDTEHASESAGAFAVTDARLLAFPLRSLSGLFAWVTCPAALERFVRDARVGGLEHPVQKAAVALVALTRKFDSGDRDTQALVAPKSPLIADEANKKLVFEEFDYNALEQQAVAEFGKELDTLLGGEEMRLKSHLAVISDNAFAFSTRYATEVSARIKLNPETKTVEGGALFYQEFLPAGTIFSALAFAEKPHGKTEYKEIKNAAGVMKYVEEALNESQNVLQIGGDASIGKGLCTAVLIAGKGGN